MTKVRRRANITCLYKYQYSFNTKNTKYNRGHKPKVRIDIWCKHGTVNTVYSLFCPPFSTSFLPNNVYHAICHSINQIHINCILHQLVSSYHLTKYGQIQNKKTSIF